MSHSPGNTIYRPESLVGATLVVALAPTQSDHKGRPYNYNRGHTYCEQS